MIDTFILSLLVGINFIYTIWADNERSKGKTPLSSVEWHMFKDRDFIALLKELKKLINENHNDTRNTIRDNGKYTRKYFEELIQELSKGSSEGNTDKKGGDDEEEHF